VILIIPFDIVLGLKASLTFLKLIIGYSSFICFMPIIPPSIVPPISIVKSKFIFIIGVSIRIIPPILFNFSTAFLNSDSLSVLIVYINFSFQVG